MQPVAESRQNKVPVDSNPISVLVDLTYHIDPAMNGKNVVLGVEFHNVCQAKSYSDYHRVIRMSHRSHFRVMPAQDFSD